jgi:hypothetical protein
MTVSNGGNFTPRLLILGPLNLDAKWRKPLNWGLLLSCTNHKVGTSVCNPMYITLLYMFSIMYSVKVGKWCHEIER